MEMKNWIIGLVLLGIAIPFVNGEHLQDESDRGFLGQRKFSANPPKESEGFLGPPTGGSNQNEDVDEEAEDADQAPAGLIIRDTDLKGTAGILVIQNGPSSSLPLMFELQPVSAGSKDSFAEMDDDELPEESEDDEISDETDVMIVSNNRFKPGSSLDTDSEEDEEDEEDDEEDGDFQDIAPPKRRIRPTVKPKRKQANQVSNSDRGSARPSKKPKRPVSKPIQKKRRRNQNKPQNPKKNKNKNKNKNQNKNKNRNRKRKPNNKRKRPQTGLKKTRRKNTGNRDVYDYMNHNVNRKKHLGVNVRKGSGSQTVTNTVTTTQTGSADDEPNVNYIVINKPAPAPTTENPFWDILGRSTRDDEEDRSFRARKVFSRRSLG